MRIFELLRCLSGYRNSKQSGLFKFLDGYLNEYYKDDNIIIAKP